MLKRVNIHIDDSDLKALDKIATEIQADKISGWGMYSIKRATLIRYAIANTFGFVYTHHWPSADTLKASLKKVLKKAE